MQQRGWLKLWRGATMDDLDLLDPYAFKLWIHLYTQAQHTSFKDLEPGDVRVTYRDLMQRLGAANGKPWHQNTLTQAIEDLVRYEYIAIVSSHPGRGTVIRINRYQEMQSQEPGFEFSRFEHPPEAESDSG